MTTRTRKRQNLNVQNRYDAGGNGRRTAGWNPGNSGPRRAVAQQPKIRDRAHDLVRNDWFGESSVTKQTTALIGIGIAARFDRILDRKRRREITDLFSDFMQQVDADGVLNLYGQQTLVTRSWLEAGECFVRARPRSFSAGLTVPVQYQILETDMLPMLDAMSWPGMPLGNRICQGIELTNRDSRAAYWFYKSHPGEMAQGQSATISDLVRVPASQVRHVFKPKRPGQLRGVSILAPVMQRMRMSGDFEDAVLDRQRLANLFVTFLTKTLPDEKWNDLDIDPLTGELQSYADGGSPLTSLEPGMQQELRVGEDVKFSNPPEAGISHSDYMRSVNLGSAAGTNTPYEILTGDIANVSDRTLRVVIQEWRRFLESDQWQIIIPMFCQPAVEWFANYAFLAGKVTAAEVDLIRRCTHSPHGWAYLHPTQDAQGKKIEIDAGITARSDVIAAKGDDPEEIDAKRAADRQREIDAGLLDPTPAEVAANAAKASQAVTQGAQANREAREHNDHMRAIGLAMSRPAPASTITVAAPVVNVTNEPAPAVVIPAPVVNVEPTVVNVTNEPAAPLVVPAPIVNVTNEPTVVNVEPAVVNVTNDVQPADVVVTLPVRQTDTSITRDANGNIAKVVQTEKTVD